jgi:hypothetical protein
MAANGCDSTCLDWASGRYNNGHCLNSRSNESLINPTNSSLIAALSGPSDRFLLWRYIVSSFTLLLCFYCIYFYLVRLKAKSSMRLIVKDYLDFLYIVVGCSAMVLFCISEIGYRYNSSCPIKALATFEIIVAITDCAFIMSNASASFRLMSVSFKLVTGFGKANQEKFKWLFLFVAALIFSSAFVSMIGIVIICSKWYQFCGESFIFTGHVFVNTYPNGQLSYWFRFFAILVSVFVYLLAFFVALRNFDSRPVQTTSQPFLRRPSDSVMKFGRWRRILVLSSTLFTAISWLLLDFLVFLPQIMDDTRQTQNINASYAFTTFYDSCSSNYSWSSLSLIITLSPAAAIIRVVAYPICSMVATRSFESGANRKKEVDSLKTLSMRVVHKADGAAAFRLGQSSRFSADDWNVAATNA